MASDGSVNYDVTADTKGFTGPLGSANQMIGGIGRGIGGLIGPITALVGVAGGLAGIGKALGGAAQVENLGIAFEVMTGSAERGKKVLDDIRKLGSQTPYEFPSLAEGGKTLLNFGITAEKIVPTLRMLGDIAGGDNEKMKGLSLVFGQIASTGRLMGQDLLQLINAGFNPLQEISERTGESMADLKKRMEDGGVSFEEVEASFRAATSEGGKFFGMMEKQAGSSTGLLSTLKDTVNEIFVTLGTPLNDALKPILQGAIEVAGRLGAGLAAAIDLAKAAISQGKLGELLGSVLKLGAMEGVNALVGGLRWASQIPGRLLTLGLKQVTRLFSGDFNAVFQGMASGLLSILKGIGDVIRSSIGGPFNEIVAYFQAGLQYAVDKALEGLGKIPFLGEKLGLEGFTGRTFSELVEEAMGANDPAALKAAGEASIKEGIGAMGDALKSRASMFWEDLKDVSQGMEGFQAADVFKTDEIRDQIGKLAQSLDPAAYSAMIDALKGAGAPIADAAQEAAKTVAAPAAAVKAMGSETAGETDDPARRKIRLFGLAESEERRKGRMSRADQEKLAAGGSLLGAVTASRSGLMPRVMDPGAMPLATAAAAAASGAPAMTPPEARKATAGDSQKARETSLIDILKTIAANTEPLKQLATA